MLKFFDFALNPVVDEAESLYFRKYNDSVSFCTYFNAVPVRKIKKYTCAELIIIKLEVSAGSEVCIRTLNSDKSSDNITGCLTDSSIEYTINLSDLSDSAVFLYAEVTGGKVFSGSVYFSGKSRSVETALITCTYRREKQLTENIRYLLQKSENSDFDIIIADNASSLPDELYDSSRVTVIHRENDGGSGGYRAGMEEAVRRNTYSHIILMDDDVRVEYCAIQKVLGLLPFLKEEFSSLSMCGAMISLADPVIQFESGGNFSDSGMQTGFGYGLDLSETESLLLDEEEKDINYAAWWLVCMPLEYAASGEYPAPFFMKYDDVEYSLRCGMNIISVCGFGVWHQDFGSKYNSVSAYFDTRNYLFVMKRHTGKFTSDKAFKKARWLLMERICRQQYEFAEAVIMGYRDYLRGEDYLKAADSTALLEKLEKLKIRFCDDNELRSRYGLEFNTDIYEKCSESVFRRYMQFLIYGQAVPSVFCRKLTITDVIKDRKEHYFRADRVLHYSVADKKGYVTKKSFFKTLYLFLKFIIIHIKFSGGRK